MTIEKNNQDKQFASSIANEIIKGQSLKLSGLVSSENDLVIAELRKNLDIKFALDLIKEGSTFADVTDIGSQRHYMMVALDIMDIEKVN